MAANKPISESSLEWMPKSVWGPLLWRQLHCRALAYLPMHSESKWLDDFILNIPCPLCQAHFNEFHKMNPPDLRSRIAFFEWTVSAHNYVNRSKNKKEYTVAEALKFYMDMFLQDK